MAEPTLKQKTAKGLFWGGLSSGVQQILNLVFGLVLARILDAEDYGMVGMLAIFSAIAGTIQESGFTAALTNQKEIRKEDYNAVFWFSALTGVVFYLILFFCAPLIAQFYGRPELIGLSRIVFLGFLFGGLGIASNAYLFKQLMAKERAKIDIIALFCSGIVGVTMALNDFAYYGLAAQTTVYIGVGSLLKLYFSPWKPSLQINFRPLREMFGFGSKLLLTNIFTQVNNNVMSVILGKFYNAQQLGFYSQGQNWMVKGYLFIGGMISSVAQPVLVETSNNIDQQRAIFRKMIRFGAFVSFPVLLGLAFVAKELIVILIGEKWLPSVPFLQLSCLWGAVVYMWLLYTNLLISHGKSDVYLKGVVCISVLQLLVILGLGILGVNMCQIVGGYVCVYYVGILMWHYCVHRIINISLLNVFMDLCPYLGSLMIAFAIALAGTVYIENIYVILVFKILVVSIVYISIMYWGNSVIFRECLNFIFKKTLNGRKTS